MSCSRFADVRAIAAMPNTNEPCTPVEIVVTPTIEERLAEASTNNHNLATCQALTMMESTRPRCECLDDAMRRIIEFAGKDKLVAYAVSHSYEHYTGLVRLGY